MQSPTTIDDYNIRKISPLSKFLLDALQARHVPLAELVRISISADALVSQLKDGRRLADPPDEGLLAHPRAVNFVAAPQPGLFISCKLRGRRMRTQTELACTLDAARERSDALFQLVRPESLYQRPIPARHRMVFYVGHLEAFDWNLLAREALDLPSFHPTFDRLFAFGIDPPPGQLPCDQPSEWPSLEEIANYNRGAREAIDRRLEALPEQLLHAAIEHRLMHAETFAYILHQLDVACKKRPAEREPEVAAGPSSPQPPWCEVAAGTAHLGLRTGQGFGWDNEFQAHEVDVPEFAIGRYKVTNGEYLEYVQAGAEAPFFSPGTRAAGFIAVCLAKCRCRSIVRCMSPGTKPMPSPAGAACGFLPSRNGIALRQARRPATTPISGTGIPLRQTPAITLVLAHPHGGQRMGVDLDGVRRIPGLPAVPVLPQLLGAVLRRPALRFEGASPQTAACFLRPSFRNWFRPSYPYVYATFRLVRS